MKSDKKRAAIFSENADGGSCPRLRYIYEEVRLESAEYKEGGSAFLNAHFGEGKWGGLLRSILRVIKILNFSAKQ